MKKRLLAGFITLCVAITGCGNTTSVSEKSVQKTTESQAQASEVVTASSNDTSSTSKIAELAEARKMLAEKILNDSLFVVPSDFVCGFGDTITENDYSLSLDSLQISEFDDDPEYSLAKVDVTFINRYSDDKKSLFICEADGVPCEDVTLFLGAEDELKYSPFPVEAKKLDYSFGSEYFKIPKDAKDIDIKVGFVSFEDSNLVGFGVMYTNNESKVNTTSEDRTSIDFGIDIDDVEPEEYRPDSETD